MEEKKKKKGGCCGCGCLIFIILIFLGACGAIFGEDDSDDKDNNTKSHQSTKDLDSDDHKNNTEEKNDAKAKAEADAKAKAEADTKAKTCLNIRGNISSSGEKIYHLPNQRFYSKTDPEQVFCTEGAAVSAGYRKSKI